MPSNEVTREDCSLQVLVTVVVLTIDNKHSWLSSHDCQVPTPTSQKLEVEQQIWIFGAD
jgi:hypothetical protein